MKLSRILSTNTSIPSGTFIRFSSVNVLLKNLFKASAFSEAVDALVPSSPVNVGILHLVLVRDLTYAQNFFGSLLICWAILFSNSSLCLLVVDRRSFLAL